MKTTNLSFYSGARIIALAALATHFHYLWIVGLCLGHWAAMSLWAVAMQTNDDQQASIEEDCLFYILIGALQMFAFVDGARGNKLWRRVVFHTVSSDPWKNNWLEVTFSLFFADYIR